MASQVDTPTPALQKIPHSGNPPRSSGTPSVTLAAAKAKAIAEEALGVSEKFNKNRKSRSGSTHIKGNVLSGVRKRSCSDSDMLVTSQKSTQTQSEGQDTYHKIITKIRSFVTQQKSTQTQSEDQDTYYKESNAIAKILLLEKLTDLPKDEEYTKNVFATMILIQKPIVETPETYQKYARVYYRNLNPNSPTGIEVMCEDILLTSQYQQLIEQYDEKHGKTTVYFQTEINGEFPLFPKQTQT